METNEGIDCTPIIFEKSRYPFTNAQPGFHCTSAEKSAIMLFQKDKNVFNFLIQNMIIGETFNHSKLKGT